MWVHARSGNVITARSVPSAQSISETSGYVGDCDKSTEAMRREGASRHDAHRKWAGSDPEHGTLALRLASHWAANNFIIFLRCRGALVALPGLANPDTVCAWARQCMAR